MYHGHPAPLILDGGYAKWVEEGRSTELAEPCPLTASPDLQQWHTGCKTGQAPASKAQESTARADVQLQPKGVALCSSISAILAVCHLVIYTPLVPYHQTCSPSQKKRINSVPHPRGVSMPVCSSKTCVLWNTYSCVIPAVNESGGSQTVVHHHHFCCVGVCKL